MNLPYKIYDTLTAGELRNKLKGVSNDSHVYVVLDKSDENYDENGYFRVVHPVDSVQRELIETPDQWGDMEVERNLVLHLADEFYDMYKTKIEP